MTAAELFDDSIRERHHGPNYLLVHADAFDALARIRPSSIDLIFADPPYRVSDGGSTCRSGRRAKVDKATWDRPSGVSEDHGWNLRWLALCQRALKPSGTIWVSGTQHVIFSVGFAMQLLGFHLLNTIAWFKPNASPNLACRFFTHSNELVIWAAPREHKPLLHRFNYGDMKADNGGKQMRDVWRIPTPARGEKSCGQHPTQKPLALIDRIVRASSTESDLVLDPFNGSGTTGVSATRLGRRYIGIDLSADYLDLTERRLSAAREPAA